MEKRREKRGRRRRKGKLGARKGCVCACESERDNGRRKVSKKGGILLARREAEGQGGEKERRRGTGRYAPRNILEYLRNLVAGH